MNRLLRITAIMTVCLAVHAQDAPKQQSQVTVENAAGEAAADYVLGAGDQIRIRVVHVEELPDDPITIGVDGGVSLPYIGRVHLAGLTPTEAEQELDRRYRQYLVRPDISISVVEFQSQPVSVLGAVRTPGVQQVRGKRTLVEMLSLAGGLSDNAGSRLKVTRRLEWGPLPLPNAKKDATGQFSVAEISLKSLFEARNPEENIQVKPDDVISVPQAETVYVLGNVLKAGPYVIDEHEKMTALQAVSMAGGMDNRAQPKEARILRRIDGQMERTEIAINLRSVIEGKSPDVAMQPEDILFVPNNAPKSVGLKALDIAIQMGTGVVIWNRY